MASTTGGFVHQADAAGAIVVAVAIDGRLAGEIVLADTLRAGTGALLGNLKRLGIERIVLATGDRREVAEAATAGLAFSAVRSELTPDQKVMVVLSERKYGPVMMVGDGVNDAPALAAADVGVAMGARGAAASAEAADVVLLVDQLDRVVPAIEIASRSRVIALQSVYAGIGLSLAGMLAAAAGIYHPGPGRAGSGSDRRCGHSQRAASAEGSESAVKMRKRKNEKAPVGEHRGLGAGRGYREGTGTPGASMKRLFSRPGIDADQQSSRRPGRRQLIREDR